MIFLAFLWVATPGGADPARILKLEVYPREAQVRAFFPTSPPAGDLLPSNDEAVIPVGILVLPVRLSAEGFETRQEEIKLLKASALKPNYWVYRTKLRPASWSATFRYEWDFHPWRSSLIAGSVLSVLLLGLLTARRRILSAQRETEEVRSAAAHTVEELKQKLIEGDFQLEGEVIDDYTVLKLLGEGAYSRVYQAQHNEWSDLAAIKLLKQESKDEEILSRMKREIEIGRELKHPNVVRMFAFGTFRGAPYIVSEFVPGRPLDTVLKDGKFSIDRACRVVAQIASGLEHAHNKGIIHRDLKPGNLFLGDNDQMKILDFGLARLLDADQKLTKTGQALGTPLYMSPEQIRGQCGPESDFYALGVIFFELVTGQTPFVGDRAMALLSAHAFTKPPMADDIEPAVPKEIAELIDQMLIKRPEQRMADATEIKERLEQHSKA